MNLIRKISSLQCNNNSSSHKAPNFTGPDYIVKYQPLFNFSSTHLLSKYYDSPGAL